jgi:hypothetical protein
MALKNKRMWIFLSILIVASSIGTIFALNGVNHNSSKNPNENSNGLDGISSHFEIVNVWSHDGSPISPGPPTPPEKDTFLPQEDIYVVIKTKGTGQKTVRIYIVENESWKNNATMSDVSSDGYNEVIINATQSPQYHGPYRIWKAPLTVGSYDIVVDENLNGIRDPGEKVDDSAVVPGVFVIPDLPLGSLMAIVASFVAMVVFSKHTHAHLS